MANIKCLHIPDTSLIIKIFILLSGFTRENFHSLKFIHKTGVFRCTNDFDKNGVIYAMGSSFRTTRWINPRKSGLVTRVTTTRCSDKLGSARDLFDNLISRGWKATPTMTMDHGGVLP